MTLSLSISHTLPAFAYWPASSACVEKSAQIVPVTKLNRRFLAQGCYSMTD
jgi:hypothetical protein